MHEMFGKYVEKYTETDSDLKEDSISRRFTKSNYDCYIQRQRIVNFNKPR